MTDANARIGSEQMMPEAPSRASGNITTRGRALLSLGRDLDLMVLNGMHRFGQKAARCTSFQPRGSSVIDLAIVNQAMYSNIMSFSVGDHESEWSDHAPIVIKINWTATSESSLTVR
ncbi:hypothetical protein BDP27DRAFT_1228217, partial [Rhodocollybia butyracea]